MSRNMLTVVDTGIAHVGGEGNSGIWGEFICEAAVSARSTFLENNEAHFIAGTVKLPKHNHFDASLYYDKIHCF